MREKMLLWEKFELGYRRNRKIRTRGNRRIRPKRTVFTDGDYEPAGGVVVSLQDSASPLCPWNPVPTAFLQDFLPLLRSPSKPIPGDCDFTLQLAPAADTMGNQFRREVNSLP